VEKKNKMAKANISIQIKELVLAYKKHPYDINNGDCEEFADEIVKKIKRARIEWGDENLELFGPEHEPECHCYIVYKGKYYDAEEPYGVESPAKLPVYFRQALQNNRAIKANLAYV
jgi:hypothetical protein